MSLRILLAIALFMAPLAAGAAIGGVGAIFGALIGGAAGNAVSKSAASQLMVEEALVNTTDQINRLLPITLDPDTRWDSTVAGPGRRFTYHYTILTMRASKIDTPNFRRVMVTRLRKSVCASPDTQVFIKNGVTVSYSYRGRDGRHVCNIDIWPRDCA